jgi:hypothetical protein
MALTRLGLNQSINLATNITGTLATGNGGTGATSFLPSKMLQQVITQTTSVTNCTDDSFIDLTGMTASITPVSASSTILFTVSGVINMDTTNTDNYVVQNIYNVTDSSEEEQRTIIRVDNASANPSYSYPYHQITWFYKRASWGTSAKSFKCQMKNETSDPTKWNRNAFATGSAQFMITEISD